MLDIQCSTNVNQHRPSSTNMDQHRPRGKKKKKGRNRKRSRRKPWTEGRQRPRSPSPRPPSRPQGRRQRLGRPGRWPGRSGVQGRSIVAYPAGGSTYPGGSSPRANGWPDGRESWPAASGALGCPPGPRSRGAAVLVWPLCGRESIFLFSHTNEFCGKSKVAPEAGVAWIGLKVGRRVCERGQQRKQLPARCSSPQGKQQRAQRLCRSAGWPAHPGNRASKHLYLILQGHSAVLSSALP
jgi:hypothetical protein